jgi:hypothetical protein
MWTVFDLDGCLSDYRHRRHFLDAKAYASYHDLLRYDSPMNVQQWERAERRLVVTSRPIRHKAETIDWIHRNLGGAYELVMRPDGDMRASPELKVDLLRDVAMLDPDEVKVCYDDREDVVGAYLDAGYCAVQLGAPVTVPQILHDMAETFRERDAQYGQTYLRFGGVCAAAFPRGIQLDGADQFARFGVVVQCFGKLLRYVAQPNGHKDSAHDLAVYAAILESLTEDKP